MLVTGFLLTLDTNNETRVCAILRVQRTCATHLCDDARKWVVVDVGCVVEQVRSDFQDLVGSHLRTEAGGRGAGELVVEVGDSAGMHRRSSTHSSTAVAARTMARLHGHSSMHSGTAAPPHLH